MSDKWRTIEDLNEFMKIPEQGLFRSDGKVYLIQSWQPETYVMENEVHVDCKVCVFSEEEYDAKKRKEK